MGEASTAKESEGSMKAVNAKGALTSGIFSVTAINPSIAAVWIAMLVTQEGVFLRLKTALFEASAGRSEVEREAGFCGGFLPLR
jgi:hypothetical protein